MAYKKYIKKNGKLYGPYTYHSRRVNGKVVSEYHGTTKKPSFHNLNKGKFFSLILPLIGVFLFVALGGFLFLTSNSGIGTGQAVLDLLGVATGEGNESVISADALIEIGSGELIPAESKVFIEFLGENSSENYEFELRDLILDETFEGEFYLDNTEIRGSGEGYGIPGTSFVYPEVEFILEVLHIKEVSPSRPNRNPEVNSSKNSSSSSPGNSNSSGNQGGGQGNQGGGQGNQGGGQGNGNDNENQGNSNSNTNPQGRASKITGAVVEGSGDFLDSVKGSIYNLFTNLAFNLKISGNVVSDDLSVEEIEGSASKGKDFTYKIAGGESARIKPGSVVSGSGFLEDDILGVKVRGKEVSVSTDYSEQSEGFGSEYTGNEKKIIGLSLSDLGIDFSNADENGSVSIRVEYQEELIFLIEKPISDLIEDSKNIRRTGLEDILNGTIINGTINRFSIGNLTESEIEFLVEEFGNVSVKTSKAERVGDRILVRLELGDYWIEHSYEDEGNIEELVEVDRIRWMRQLVYVLSLEAEEKDEFEGLLKDYPLTEEEETGDNVSILNKILG